MEEYHDANKWICSCTKDLEYSLEDVCMGKNMTHEEIEELECYIEFDE